MNEVQRIGQIAMIQNAHPGKGRRPEFLSEESTLAARPTIMVLCLIISQPLLSVCLIWLKKWESKIFLLKMNLIVLV